MRAVARSIKALNISLAPLKEAVRMIMTEGRRRGKGKENWRRARCWKENKWDESACLVKALCERSR